MRRYENQVFNFLRQFTRNPQDAEDLTQETFVKALSQPASLQPSLAFAPWLFVIARRTAASHFRSAEHFEELPVDSEAAEENPATALEQSDEQKSLWKLVRTLKPKQAEAVWLRYAEGFSVAETARVMGTNQVHVKVLLHRARSNLSKMLNARGMAPPNLTIRGTATAARPPLNKSESRFMITCWRTPKNCFGAYGCRRCVARLDTAAHGELSELPNVLRVGAGHGAAIVRERRRRRRAVAFSPW